MVKSLAESGNVLHGQGDSGFEGLEEAVTALDAGESTSLELAFPENFRERKLAGHTAMTNLKLVSVAEGKLPEVDEDFIKSFGIESYNFV